MPGTYTHKFDTPAYKGEVTINTGLFIGGQWVDPVEGGTTGKVITSVAAGTKKDVDLAVDAAKKAYKTTWGLHCPGAVRGKLLNKLANLIEEHIDEFAALDPFQTPFWRVQGKTIETNEKKLAYTRHEPYGVVGQITPWNFPLGMVAWKIGPALATGNTTVLKPSEITPLTALKLAGLINEAGFPPGVVNIVNGYGATVGQAISEHPLIEKIAFTGSTLTGRKILKASAESNLKVVTLELGGKSPCVIFDDANLDQAIKWASFGIFAYKGQSCVAGSRIFVQEGIYDLFLTKFTAIAADLTSKTGDPFGQGTEHGPQVSKIQFDQIMGYIDSGKAAGATVHHGGEPHGNEGYFIKPTIFTDVHPDMKIVKEEIFGPVAVIVNRGDTTYGLAAHIFSDNISRAIRVAHAVEAGSTWVNCAQTTEINVPFGGYKQSGIGRELGEYALDTYTQVKAVHVNIGQKL
ncbi:aldehyde dehydrogenase [Phlegmacium glaucopus]|nr:aldehyde dehydrogenase [Phlegmacium glaucopus]